MCFSDIYGAPQTGVKAMPERTGYIINGKPYEPLAMYDAMEHISGFLSKVRLMAADLLENTDQQVVSYCDAKRAGRVPSLPASLGHDVYLRTAIILDSVVSIEAELKRFDIHPD